MNTVSFTFLLQMFKLSWSSQSYEGKWKHFSTNHISSWMHSLQSRYE